MRAETKPPGGFVLSPEIPAALDSMAIFRTLCGSFSSGPPDTLQLRDDVAVRIEAEVRVDRVSVAATHEFFA